MKKRCLFIVLLASCLSLSASQLKIGVYDSSAGMLYSDVEAALEVLASSDEAESFLTSINMERDSREFSINRESSVHSALERESSFPAEAVFEYSSYRDSDASIVQIANTAYLDSFLKEASVEAADFVMRLNNLDMLVYLYAEREGQLVSYEMQLFTYGEVSRLDGGLFIISGRSDLFADILRQLSNVIAPEAGFVSVADFPPGAVFSIDGEEVSFSSGEALVHEGVHTVTASALGYEPYVAEFEVSRGELVSISSGMVESEFSPVTFQSVPYDALFSYSGLDGVPLPFTLEDAHYPVIATVSREGFMPSSLQLTDGSVLETVRLRPEWMGSEDRVSDAKKNMYRSLRNTLLSLGAVAAVSAVEAVYFPSSDDNSMLVPVRAVTVGLSVISLVDLIYNLGVYYNTARDTYL